MLIQNGLHIQLLILPLNLMLKRFFLVGLYEENRHKHLNRLQLKLRHIHLPIMCMQMITWHWYYLMADVDFCFQRKILLYFVESIGQIQKNTDLPHCPQFLECYPLNHTLAVAECAHPDWRSLFWWHPHQPAGHGLLLLFLRPICCCILYQ